MKNINNEKTTIVNFDTNNSIILGNYLDIIMNAESAGDSNCPGNCIKEYNQTNNIMIHGKIRKSTRLNQYEHIIYGSGDSIPSDASIEDMNDYNSFVYTGGIKIPSTSLDEGSGNILIIGEPGVGKSTLAFQFAAACTSEFNNGISIYYSLDMDNRLLCKSMVRNNIDKSDQLKINFMCPITRNDSADIVNNISEILEYNNEITPQILMPQLSPRGITINDDERDNLFQKRFEELETIVKAARKYNEACSKQNNETCRIKLFVIDSLNNFGEKILKHEQLHRLFSLFKRNKIIGVFTLGKFSNDYIKYESVDMSAAQFLCDVIINLTKTHVHDYNVSYLEVTKSRHVKHVLGRHLYKIEECTSSHRKKGPLLENPFPDLMLKKELRVLPSLHYIVFGTDGLGNILERKNIISNNNDGKNKDDMSASNLFGIKEMNYVLPSHFTWGKDNEKSTAKIISIVGKSGLYKSDIAIGSLISGIYNDNCNGLIIRMADKDNLKTRGVRLCSNLLDRMEFSNSKQKTIQFEPLEVYNGFKPHKYVLSGWSIKNSMDKVNHIPPKAKLYEIIFKSGALSPETFINEISEIIHAYEIGRITILDLKLMEISYPFLVESPTSGRLFLSALVHIMKNYGIDVIFTASESQYKNEHTVVDQLCKLSDATISCDYSDQNETNKNRTVKLNGEGLITNKYDITIELAKHSKTKYKMHDIEFLSHVESEKPYKLKEIKAYEIKAKPLDKNDSASDDMA